MTDEATSVPITPQGVADIQSGAIRATPGGEATAPGDFQRISSEPKDGADTAEASNSADSIEASNGADTIEGGDSLAGDNGADTLAGGDQEDFDPFEGLAPETVEKLTPFTTEYTETGTLKPESITKAAADLGVSEDLVKFHLRTAQAAAAATSAAPAGPDADAVAIFTEVGGQENYPAFKAWLEETHADKLPRFAKARAAGDGLIVEILKPYLQEFKASGQAPGASRRNIVAESGGGKGGAAEGAVEGYASREEQLEAAGKRDDRGRRLQDIDPEYRKKHQARVIASQWQRGS